MESIREQVLRRFHFPARKQEPWEWKKTWDQLEVSLEALLYSVDLGSRCVDGWKYFKVIRESEESLKAVGLAYLLPSGSIPIEIDLRRHDGGFTWSAQVAQEDSAWLAMSHSKQWSSVCLYAIGELAKPPWTWGETFQGSVRCPGT